MSLAIAVPIPQSNRREQTGWHFYEWATAGFTTTVVAVLIGPYLTDVTKAAADANGFVHPLGVAIRAGSFFPYVISVSVLLQLILMPLLGAIADYVHFKKEMLAVSAYIGAVLTMGLYFLEGTNYLLGSLVYISATLFYSASVIFCNAFLPQIARPDERDTVSSRSWALGTLGAGLLLAANLGLLTQDGSLGLTDEMAVRIDLASAGVWWAWLPLTGCAWWWSPRPSPWNALLAVQAGVVGAEWAYIGASALAAFPNQRLTVGILWTGAAGLLAIVAAANRRRSGNGWLSEVAPGDRIHQGISTTSRQGNSEQLADRSQGRMIAMQTSVRSAAARLLSSRTRLSGPA